MSISRIKKGDSVLVISGDDKGKKGIVLSILKASDMAIVSGINIVKRSIKATEGKNFKSFEKPIRVCKLKFLAKSVEKKVKK
jgi:large subunit ribosomal protein L24